LVLILTDVLIEMGSFIPIGSSYIKTNNTLNIIIVGASGDLTKRKIMPAIYDLYKDKLLPDDFHIIGFSRTPMKDNEFVAKLNAFKSYDQKFSSRIEYIAGEYSNLLSYEKLGEAILKHDGNRLIYLAIPPDIIKEVTSNISKASIVTQCSCEEDKANSYCVKSGNWSRLIFEKPFGHDTDSAVDLNYYLQALFEEKQIYRIDHFLGKETVQNIMIFRFANSIFEPLWNNHYVDHIEINISEEVKITSRGAYFDNAGIVRDVIQNHALQLLALLTMEPPISFDADAIRDEKVKLLKSLTMFDDNTYQDHTIRGVYLGYSQEDGVKKDSKTETFAALRFFIKNWRWAGVPVYIRAGKALASKTTQAHIYFKELPHKLFKNISPDRNLPNQIIFKFQPHEGIHLTCLSKVPGKNFELVPVEMDFNYLMNFNSRLPDAYERLLLDAIHNDLSLFIRHDEIKEAWRFVDSFLKRWEKDSQFPLYEYIPGQNGPEEMHTFIERFGHLWNKEYCRLKV